MIESELKEAKQVKEEERLKCNYIYLQPSSAEQMVVRIIRSGDTRET
jgi:guanylate kinase